MRINYIKEEKGQTLIIMFVLMVLSLSVGIAISTKYIKGLRNITQSDQSSRALAVAEAAIEHLLILPTTTLEDYALNGTCTTDCHLEIYGDDGQTLIADATLTKLGNSSDPFLVNLKEDETTQISLSGYSGGVDVYICWNAADMSITGTYIHGVLGSYEADAFAYNPPTSTHSFNNFDTASPLFGYSSCIVVPTTVDPVMLRFKSMYEENIAMVIPEVGEVLPTQGILIESIGAAGDVTKTVTVIITDPVLSSQFDYVLYQKSTTEPLSN